MIRRLSQWLLALIGVPALIVLLFLAFLTVSDYRPAPAVHLGIDNNQDRLLPKNVQFTVMTFNIGYCGLDAGEDFFMDGGTHSRCRSLEQTWTNLKEITRFLTASGPDLLALQEVDSRASRSYRVDERSCLQASFPGHGAAFAVNYQVAWVPVPLTRPMGAVKSGLLTLCRYRMGAAVRYRYPGSEAWPRQLAELDRCFLQTRLPLTGGGELLLLNSHLSVFDKGGRIRKLQLAYLRQHIVAEYRKGNHVIVGGDWNHGLPGTAATFFKAAMAPPGWYVMVPEDFTPPGFAWAVDRTVPTVRSNGTAYRQGENFVAVIDGFLVSPNVEIVKVDGRDLAFRNSDHNPVAAVFILR
jgi:endonuclease/exonuclease/phosphatase family metal-dependent hydrolase